MRNLRTVKRDSLKRARIGIYAGAFDPIHVGHLAFALQALQSAKLDQVIFLPERRPRSKPGVEHYAHRVAMIKKALKPHPDLAVMEMVDRHFSVQRTLPQLLALFPQDQLVFLMGSDTVLTLPDWPYADRLLAAGELVVGVRSEHQHAEVVASLQDWPTRRADLTIVNSFAPDISSARIRQALRANQYTKGLLASVSRYARQEWLYVSTAHISV